MATRYPASIDNSTSLPTVISGVTPVNAVSLNSLRDAIIAIQTTLGPNPATNYGTIRARLDYLENNIGGGAVGGIQLAGDLGGTELIPKVIGLYGQPLSSTTPQDGYTLIYNGSAWSPGSDFANQTISTTGGIIGGPGLFGSLTTQLFDLTGKAIFNGISAGAVSDTGQAIMYFDSNVNQMQISTNAGPYFTFGTQSDTLLSYDCSAGGAITTTDSISHRIIKLTGTPAADFSIQIDGGAANAWTRTIWNTTGKNATVKGSASDTGVMIPTGTAKLLLSDGTNIITVG